MGGPLKPVTWLGDSLDRLRGFPEEVKDDVGTPLMWAQMGDKHPTAKPLRGIVTGASILEIVEDYHGDTYRAVYTVRFAETIYVLHCFQKKSKKGNETPKPDVKLIAQRFEHAKRLEKERATKKVAS
ncbi:MAG TPA: type II toxin-antitoxin system RelE/ParE family toxin [Methylomirabilota bacterium]|nr:type II toxin-antitoxin system RelE/ParE family toxin [Methylomirabilota bacterium]